MKAKLIAYWISTLLVSAFMAFAAFAYFTRNPKMMDTFASLGYPAYFPLILGTAKVLGIIALLIPGMPLLKEWAYAGFTFTFIGAFFSHLSAGQAGATVMPIVTLIVLIVSYLTRPESRRPALSPGIPVTGLG